MRLRRGDLDLRQSLGDGLAALDRVGSAAEIAGAKLRLRQHILDGLYDGGSSFLFAEMLEHHRA